MLRAFSSGSAALTGIEAISNGVPSFQKPEVANARTTMTISADLTTKITPCQFGGTPDCSNCGCMASAGLAAITRHKVLGVIRVGTLLDGSIKIGEQMRRLRPVESQS